MNEDSSPGVVGGPNDARPEPALPPGAMLGPGRRFRQARESQHLSLEEVAERLKVAPRKLAALEAERFTELPTGPYLRGLVRNYARALGLAANDLLAALEDRIGVPPAPAPLSITPGLHAPFPQRQAGSHESAASRLMTVGVVACAVVIGALLIPGTEQFRQLTAYLSARWRPAAVTAAPSTPTQVTRQLLPEPTPAVEPAGQRLSLTPGLAEATPPAAALVAAASPLPSGAVPGRNDAQSASAREVTAKAAGDGAADLNGLVMQFKDDSWVEVKQADGKILSSQVFHAGTEQAIDADAPLQVVIGNAPVVSLSYRGKPVDLDPYTHSRVAHLNLP